MRSRCQATLNPRRALPITHGQIVPVRGRGEAGARGRRRYARSLGARRRARRAELGEHDQGRSYVRRLRRRACRSARGVLARASSSTSGGSIPDGLGEARDAVRLDAESRSSSATSNSKRDAQLPSSRASTSSSISTLVVDRQQARHREARARASGRCAGGDSTTAGPRPPLRTPGRPTTIGARNGLGYRTALIDPQFLRRAPPTVPAGHRSRRGRSRGSYEARLGGPPPP